MEAARPLTIGIPRLGHRRRTCLALAAWILAVGAVTWLRTPGVPIWDTLWTEDGTVFLQSATDHSLPGALFDPYAGYLHVPARLLAEVTLWFAPEHWALVMAAISTVVAALGGAFVFVASKSVLDTRWARALVAGLPWLVVLGQEVPASAANLHWYGLYAAFWALLWRPASHRSLAAAGAVLLLVALSDPLVALGLPLAVAQARALPFPGRRRLAVIVPLLAGLTAQALTVLTVARPVRNSASSLADEPAIYGMRVAGGALLGDEWFGSLWSSVGDFAIWGAVAVAALAVATAVHVSAGAGRRAVLSAAAGSVLLFAVPLMLRGTAELTPDVVTRAGSRYMFVPALLLLCSLVIALDAHGGRRARQALTVLLLMVATSGLGVGGAPSDRSDGPSWTASVQAARAACTEGTTDVTMGIAPKEPPIWNLRLDCSRLASH
jgi:hypothetical protein